eukprot:Gb_36211 [translate_table: standard]
MLCKSFTGALLGWKEIKEIILNLCPLQQCYKIIKAILDQIILKNVCDEQKHGAFGNKAIFEDRLKNGFWWKARKFLGK